MRRNTSGRSISMESELYDTLTDCLPQGESEDMSNWIDSKDCDKLVSALLDVVKSHLDEVVG